LITEQEIIEKYKLENYHASYLLKAHELVDFSNKNVLEVGGSLPQELVINELCVSQWIGNEELSYYGEIKHAAPTNTSHEISKSTYRKNIKYSSVAGGIEDLNETYYGVFDVVFSIAAFEHINKFPEAIDKMYKALKPGGKLISIFSPLWSSFSGHHLPNIYDQDGVVFNFENSPIPPWSHLYMSRHEMYEYLMGKFDREFSAKVLYYIFNSNHINRYFLDDFVSVVNLSRFKKNNIIKIFPSSVPEDVATILTKKYGDLDFSHQGLMMLLEK